ncbi:glycosyltransferase family 39 protein [Nocardia huaxiensis]|uniref:Glycosyltransferase family 39 protein n=1 Tax=Nocardia huaxiensis TaxID=2755382 RepID=A0A7D6ZQS5_9NOCA|nr:glycosyltransferase family 39 protein [Nocardia huaxiensis]QLY33043.1 glycosyltransferase family 39 protein [Nocardia huaxiensis]UFS93194.1 glycosyltransferase family 39 protein [Nocardia huaxiensis]
MYWVAGVFAAVLLTVSNRYGYHRDELYFLAAGRHPDWGYADQPPLVPLIARGISVIDSQSLVLLRIPAILAAVAVVVCAGLMARELGAGRVGQALAAAFVASAALLMAAGHLLGTTVFDLAFWSGIVLLVLRLLRPETDPRWWLGVGVLAGLSLQNKALSAVPIAVLAVTLAAIGPRKIFATRYFPLAVGIAAVIALPYVLWQARNDWPQWELGRAIAGGSSGTSDTPLTFVLLQFGLMGPFLVPLWIFGLWWLWRQRRYRALPLTYLVLLLLYTVSSGKAYYLGGMYPLLLAAAAAGVEPMLEGRRMRTAAVVSVTAVNAVAGAALFLPIIPVTSVRDTAVLEINYDAGETIGWPEFVDQIAEIRMRAGPNAELLTANYGEAGAIERYGALHRLPTPHSGHNSYWWWGPPQDARPALLIGFGVDRALELCPQIEQVGRIDNGLGIDNEEQGGLVYLCRAPRAGWAEMWPSLRRFG